MTNIESIRNTKTHIAVIMDGNGRWAKSKGVEISEGHIAGVDALRETVIGAWENGVRYLTVYAFSTENWSRSQSEVDALMQLFSKIVLAEAKDLANKNIRLKFIGDVSKLPLELQQQIKAAGEIELETEQMILTVAMNYSSRWDIVQAAEKYKNETKENAEKFAKQLSTNFLPDVDLIIRTSGEQRLSNFLLWESAYAELYFTDILWPDFKKNELKKALEWYIQRKRRFGGR